MKKLKIPTGKQPLYTRNTILLSVASAILIIILFSLAVQSTKTNINDINNDFNKKIISKNSSSAAPIDLPNALRTSTVAKIIAEESIPAYSITQILALDVSKPSGATVSDLKLVSQGALKGLEQAFVDAEKNYGINCLFVMAIASHESANGTMCFKPNNMFGYGSSGFSSKAEGIDVVSRALAQNYLSPGGSLYSGKTISSINKRYAASTTWDSIVASRMTGYYSKISANHNAAINKLK